MRTHYTIFTLFLSAAVSLAATREEVKVKSERMNKDVPVTVILPDTYTGEKRFPVLYLLHGAGGSHKVWSRKTPIVELAEKHQMIVVCPDSDKSSWYFDSPINPKSQYETFTAKELVKYVDANYRTRAERGHRAIAGLSMGGHGALFLGIRHKDVFSVAVSMSGGVDIRPFSTKWGIRNRIGEIDSHKENWEKRLCGLGIKKGKRLEIRKGRLECL